MKLVYVYVLGALLAYLIGTFSPSYILAKAKNTDMKGKGTGNLGASNTTLLLGWKWGVVVGAMDILKACIPIVISKVVFSEYIYLPYVVAVCIIMGHIFPFYLKFRGGKGFATFFGSMLGLSWPSFILIGALFLIIVWVSDYMVAGTFSVIGMFPIYVGITTRNIILVLIILAASLVILLKHKENIKRIKNKEEVGIRAAFSGKKKD
ncbi:MAG: glycerol-3-phosphate acyltransferase [Lachnospiraceae bacterium]|nr:glycerol-3-phosphate acyltransferase [Lachnospiraceae bacterium]